MSWNNKKRGKIMKKNLIVKHRNTNSNNGFNFDYTIYMILKNDWYKYNKTQDYYLKEYVCDNFSVSSLSELKNLMDNS